jgi:hypothetical protein
MSRMTTQNFDHVSNSPSDDPSMLINNVLLLYVHVRDENVRNICCFCDGGQEAVAKVDVLQD